MELLNPKANQVQEVNNTIRKCRDLLKLDGKERYEFIHQLVNRVRVLADSIDIKINPNALFDDLPNQIEPITISSQAKIERCGMAIRLMVGNRTAQQLPDQALINSIRKAQNWIEELTSGKMTSVGMIALQEGTTSNVVTRMMYRAFLAPDIIKAIMNGTQPASLNSDRLKNLVPLPLDWEDQRKLLGFN